MKRDEELPPANHSSPALKWWALGITVAVLSVALYFYLLPPPPKNWSKVKVGMTIDEVKKIVPEIHIGRIGADAYSSKDDTRYWALVMNFDDSGEITAVELTYRYQPWSWLNRPLIEITRNQ